MAKIEKTSAIILAAGISKRFGQDKQFVKLGDKYVIQITVEVFEKIEEVSEIILALSNENIEKYSQIFKNPKIKVVLGGKTRMESLKRSFEFLSPSSVLVAVHDGARPFIEKDIILNCLKTALDYGACVPVVPIKDTIKEINEDFEVIKTIDRKKHYAIQTPQCYRKEILKEMLENKFSDNDLTDDSQILEKMGKRIKAVYGDYKNIKITTVEDFWFAEAIWKKIKN